MKNLEIETTAPPVFNQNNFDLIRLFAAAQVACLHAGEHLGSDWLMGVNRWLQLFPGVPIFFLISGFLISRSYEQRRSSREYFRNRALRIYPALWVCAAVSLVLVWFANYRIFDQVGLAGFGAWLAAQLSFIQFYNPDFLRGYGVGVLNGSLWTISVELQFYLLVPAMYWFLSRFDPRRYNRLLLSLLLLFAGINECFFHFQTALGEKLVKLIGVSFFPWFYMFLFGVYLQRNFALVGSMLRYRLILLPAAVSVVILMQRWGWSKTGNGLAIACFTLLALAVVLLAYSAPWLSERLLRRNDASYGIYIYHMPLVNFLRQVGVAGNTGALLALAGTAVVSVCSWKFLEKRVLAHKAHSLRAFT
jgi:peptidoglycan/LPS O-acetylase OafA/YrhL